MKKSSKKIAEKSLEDDLEKLLDKLCRDAGFCLSAQKSRQISTSRRLDADEFANAVLLAEGFEHPEYESKHLRLLKLRFTEWFGRAVVSTTDYDSAASD